jgi:hypothetical protein
MYQERLAKGAGAIGKAESVAMAEEAVRVKGGSEKPQG